jgi:hypothetical protein
LEHIKTAILNLGAGKMEIPLGMSEFRVHVDRCYENLPEKIHNLESICIYQDMVEKKKVKANRILYYAGDIFEFLEKYPKKFDEIELYRVLEHIPRDKVLYFIYLMADILKDHGIIEVVCPDYKKLAQMILNDLPTDATKYEQQEIVLYTELFNEPNDPHCFITTHERLERVFTLENRFKILDGDQPVSFENRTIYFQMKFQRIPR